MTCPTTTPKPLPRSARSVVGDDLSSLARILEPDVNVCVMKRALPFEIDGFIGLQKNTSIRFHMSEGVHPSITNTRLAADLTFLAGLLSELTGADDIRVRLCRRSSPMCPQFHADYVTLRLLCTYIGPGTEWVDEGSGSHGFECHNTRRQGRARFAVPGDIVLLKGETWEGNEGRGAVHRSPLHDTSRLVATLDPL